MLRSSLLCFLLNPLKVSDLEAQLALHRRTWSLNHLNSASASWTASWRWLELGLDSCDVLQDLILLFRMERKEEGEGKERAMEWAKKLVEAPLEEIFWAYSSLPSHTVKNSNSTQHPLTSLTSHSKMAPIGKVSLPIEKFSSETSPSFTSLFLLYSWSTCFFYFLLPSKQQTPSSPLSIILHFFLSDLRIPNSRQGCQSCRCCQIQWSWSRSCRDQAKRRWLQEARIHFQVPNGKDVSFLCC